MNVIRIRSLTALVLIGAALCSLPARAEYTYTFFDFPGATFTDAGALNDRGQVAGQAWDSSHAGLLAAFIYDARHLTYTTVSAPAGYPIPWLNAISNSGTSVGGAATADWSDIRGFIHHRDGRYELIAHPASVGDTDLVGVNDEGIVAGTCATETDWLGFVYDTRTKKFTDIVSAPLEAHVYGVNNRGEMVGSARFLADGLYPGSTKGLYGFFRSREGVMTWFRVNGVNTNPSAINDSGEIVGWAAVNAADAFIKGFVLNRRELTGASGPVVAITRADTELMTVPGAVFFEPWGVNDEGVISGLWFESSDGINLTAGHGFIARAKKATH